jgi:hypothetical protein
MRVNVNLATQKYEDARAFFTRWGSAIAVAALVTIVLGTLAVLNYSDTEKDRKIFSDMRRQIDESESGRVANESILNRSENREAREQARFWNDVIDQKSFSWTRLFSDMEKIMPARAFVMSVKPALDTDKLDLARGLKLDLVIGGEKHEDAVELVRKMEGSDHFRQPHITAESVTTPARGGQAVVEFRIETFYAPATPTRLQAGARDGAL